MTRWETEKELADELKTLTEKLHELQNEIRGGSLSSRRDRGVVLPFDDDRRLRSLVPDLPSDDDEG